MAKWQTKSSEVVYETPWFKVRRDEVLNHRDKPLTYSVVALHSPSVFIIALNEAGEILMQKNYRYPVGRDMWEMPAGHSDGQELLEAAKRELLEEAGLQSDDWRKLGTYYQANGIGDMPGAYFLARNVRHASDERDEDEDITDQRFVSVSELESMIRGGEIECGPVLVGLELAKLNDAWKEQHA